MTSIESLQALAENPRLGAEARRSIGFALDLIDSLTVTSISQCAGTYPVGGNVDTITLLALELMSAGSRP
jgi:hypothetical protein